MWTGDIVSIKGNHWTPLWTPMDIHNTKKDKTLTDEKIQTNTWPCGTEQHKTDCPYGGTWGFFSVTSHFGDIQNPSDWNVHWY